jgi:hypothetical protein
MAKEIDFPPGGPFRKREVKFIMKTIVVIDANGVLFFNLSILYFSVTMKPAGPPPGPFFRRLPIPTLKPRRIYEFVG